MFARDHPGGAFDRIDDPDILDAPVKIALAFFNDPLQAIVGREDFDTVSTGRTG
jgi:hypothetical protein